jgi:hypothetical protein
MICGVVERGGLKEHDNGNLARTKEQFQFVRQIKNSL